MDALEAIAKRRSVRKYTGEPIPREDLLQIVDAARLAATGSNRQAWDFIVITQASTIRQLLPAGSFMDKAGAVIAVVMDPSSRWWVEDGAAAIENMLIACTAMGYGACWVEGDALPRETEFKALLGIPAEKRLLALMPVGVPAEWPSKEKKTIEEIIHWEKF